MMKQMLIAFLMCAIGLLAVAKAAETQVTTARTEVVCFGDSITKRGYDAIISKTWDVDTVMAGVAGNSTAQALRRMSQDVLEHNPDIVVILFGTNDLRVDAPKVYVTVDDYKKNLETMIDACTQQGAEVILCTLPPINQEIYFSRHEKKIYDDAGGLTQMIADYRAAALQVGADRKVPVVDLNQLLLKTPQWMSHDGVHPTSEGTAIIAAHIGQAVATLLKKDA
jgi:lysophospholipase L1-like esterase